MANALYLDCSSGIAGDMLVAALLEAGGDWSDLDARLQTLPLPDAKWELREVVKNGFAAKQFVVTYPPQHAHRHLSDIQKILDQAEIGAAASEIAMRLFTKLGESEAAVHGTDLKKVHFHEVGAIDSIVDIVSIAILMDQLQIQQVMVGRICTGFGTVKIAHGEVAVPAPATVRLLQGFPVYAGSEEGEMVTPTGAAFLAAYAKPVDGMPDWILESNGTGAGNMTLKSRANVVRAYLGKLNSIDIVSDSVDAVSDSIDQSLIELQFQVDDMTGQQLGHLQSLLFDAGVNDCFLTAVQMKKGRPGTLVTVLCAEQQRPDIQSLIFANSTTIGVRRTTVQRSILKRHASTIESEFGSLAAKTVSFGEGEDRTTVEFDEVIRVSKETNRSVLDVASRLAANANSDRR